MAVRFRITLFAAVVAMALMASSCGGGDDPVDGGDAGNDDSESVDTVDSSTTTSTTVAPIEEGPKAPFTGLPADEDLLAQPAVVVKVSNNDDRSLEALVGIDHADLIIEERIEDRATRFAVIFHSDLPDTVGPVRSGRSSDLDLLANLGTPILVFSGANIAVLGQLRDLAAEGRVVLVANDDSDIYLVRSAELNPPDNLFTDPGFVRQDFGDQASPARGIVSFRTADTDPRPTSAAGPGVTVVGRDSVSFVYDPTRGYVRVQDDAVHATREGDALVAENVVIMETVYAPSQIAAGSVDAITIGAGPATVLIGGRRWSGTWNRASRDDGYTFRADNGEEILLEPGRTWLSLAPVDTYEFSVDDETAGLVLGTEG